MKTVAVSTLLKRLKKNKLTPSQSAGLLSLIVKTYKWDKESHEIKVVNFDWDRNSSLVIKYLKERFDKDKFNWVHCSGRVAELAPRLIDKDKYCWHFFSANIAKHVPDLIDHDKFNWAEAYAVYKYHPSILKDNLHKLDQDRFAPLIKKARNSL